LTLLRSLFTASNTVCGIDGVTGGLFAGGLPVALGSFSVAVELLVFGVLADAVFAFGFVFRAGFFAVTFFAVVGFFVIFAMIGLLVFLAEQLSAFLNSFYLYFYANDAIKRIRGYYAHDGIGDDIGCV
jgi:hypothetical protein